MDLKQTSDCSVCSASSASGLVCPCKLVSLVNYYSIGLNVVAGNLWVQQAVLTSIKYEVEEHLKQIKSAMADERIAGNAN